MPSTVLVFLRYKECCLFREEYVFLVEKVHRKHAEFVVRLECYVTSCYKLSPLVSGRERLAARGAGGHGAEAGGRSLKTDCHRGGEEAVALHGAGRCR